ncbi:MAG: extracellular solute-binding protein [Oscillospiraceae bacterium]|nr:extracellular solute-binding protein [Oscillospiraceae bacterium]
MKIKKKYAVMICSILAIGILLVSSCQTDSGKNNDVVNSNAADGNGESPAISAEAASEQRLEPDLPPGDFGGMEITLLGRAFEPGMTVKHFSETGSAEENGEIMNDAIYRRNAKIEEQYNVNIKGIISGDKGSLSSDIKKSINAGDDAFDAAFASIGDASGLSQNGFLADLKKVPNLDLAKPWWDQRAVNSLSVGGKLFFTLGDITPWADPFTWIVVVNKELIRQYALDSPYELVRNNNWTFDTFYEYCAAVSGDTNGDGIINEFDRHGVMSARENYVFQFIAGGESLVKKDSDDLPYLAVNNDRAVNVAQKIFDMMSDKNATLLVEDYSSGYSDPWFEVLRAQFRNGNGLFYMGGLEQMCIFRDLETEIGILPMPKYDSGQNGYYHIINTYWASSLAVPVTNNRLDETGFILEALCAESRYTVRPAFYDYTLTRKMMRDEDSVEMLDIVLSSRSYDLGMIYNWGDVTGIFSNMLGRQAFTFSSDIEKKKDSIDKQINKAIDNFMQNN